MSNVYNQGPRTLAVRSGDIPAYMLVDYGADGAVGLYVSGSGAILEGSTIQSDLNDYVTVQNCNAEGSRYLQLDNGETIAVGGLFTFGDAAGTIKPMGTGDPLLGYTRTAATSAASPADRAICECVLFPFAAAISLQPVMPSWPVGPVTGT